MRVARLSFPVICGVVLVFHAVLFAPVLPSVTPDIELWDGSDIQPNLVYEIIPQSSNRQRLKRQVSIPATEDPTQAGDKSLLNKNPVAITKKPLDSKATLGAQPQDGPTPSANPNSQNPPANSDDSHVDNTSNSNAVGTEGNEAEDAKPFLDDIQFDGDSTYLKSLNKTHYKEQENVTFRKLENFRYYNVSVDTDGVRKYWVNMNDNLKATKHGMLSHAHRRAATVKPKFPIMFYGHHLPNLTVATGGFIYLGDQVHAWLAATQYVAPLMANFDSSTSPNATVSYLSDENAFTVEWNEVRLQDSPEVKPFTFQTTLHKNGTIVFVYKQVPIPVTEINDTNHPVKVGLSDAYIKDKNMLFVKQKTIYEYDRVDIKHHSKVNITNGTAIIFEPATTCLQLLSCETCTTVEIQFKCSWCPVTNKCSNGTDRYNQEWTQKGCDKPSGNLTTIGQCLVARDTSSSYNVATDRGHDDDHDLHGGIHSADEKSSADSYVKKVKAPESEGMSAAGVIGVMFLMMLIFGGVGWLAYAYFFPHSPSGQMLIRYRPSQWAFRRGEARYTAASIHM